MLMIPLSNPGTLSFTATKEARNSALNIYDKVCNIMLIAASATISLYIIFFIHSHLGGEYGF